MTVDHRPPRGIAWPLFLFACLVLAASGIALIAWSLPASP